MFGKMTMLKKKHASWKLREKVKKSKLRYGLNKVKRDEEIIISLTSYGERLKVLDNCLKSILLQTLKPDKIIVWLDCNTTKEQLLDNLIEYEKYGVEFRFMKQNLRPHMKYFYAMKEFKNSIIITVDDDLIYPQDLISSLYGAHKEHPKAVCARRVHEITLNKNNEINPYKKWNFESTDIEKPSFKLIATGVGGVLYPPNSIDERGLDEELIKKLCLGADDIWLKVMEVLAGTPVCWVKNNMIHPPIVNDTQNEALNISNVSNNQNDEYLKNILEYFSVSSQQLINGK